MVCLVGAVALGLPHFAATRRLSESWRNIFHTGVETITGKSAVELGQFTKKKALENNFSRALATYERLKGKAPQALEDLVREGLLQKSDLVDEWGRSLQFEANHKGITLRSAGPDGHFNTGDDWTLGG